MAMNKEDSSQYLKNLASEISGITKNIDLVPERLKQRCLDLLELALKHQDDFYIGVSYVLLADCTFYYDHDILLVSKYLNLAFSYLANSKDKIMIKYYTLKSFVFEEDEEYLEILKCQQKILQLIKETGDETYLVSYFSSIGHLFKECKDFESALFYYKKAELEFEKKEDKYRDISYLNHLTHMIDIYCALNDASHVREYQEKISYVSNVVTTKNIILNYTSMLYSAMNKNKDGIKISVERLLDEKVMEHPNTILRNQLIKEILRCLLIAKDKEYLDRVIREIQSLEDDSARSNIEIQRYLLEYNSMYNNNNEKQLAYKKFYENYQKNMKNRNKNRIQTFTNLIQIKSAMNQKISIEKDNLILEREVLIDELSGLFGRRYLDVIKSQCKDLTHEQIFAIAVIDIDYFKEYNDNYGHIKGDEVIRQVADSLRKYSTNEIISCRYGGDEFYTVWYDANEDKVVTYIQDVMKDLNDKNIEHGYSKCSDRVTVSIGYYLGVVNSESDLIQLLDYADQSIYVSKRKGRNTYSRYVEGGNC